MQPILDSLPADWPTLVWDNSKRPEPMDVYGHFAALPEIQTEYAYFQDDDAICPAAELLAAWDETLHGDKVLLNVPDGETPWVSWGGICHRDLPGRAISRYVDAYGFGNDVRLWCDLILAMLAPWENVDLYDQVTHLPYARAANRMCMNPTHYGEQARVKTLCRALLTDTELARLEPQLVA